MRVWFILALFFSLVGFAAFGGDHRFRLKSHQWKHRLLLVFAPNPYSAANLGQRAQFDTSVEGFRERDLLYIPLVPGETSTVRHQRIDLEAQASLRSEFGIQPEQFIVLLIGKDGGVKLRSEQPITAREVFALIDSMPMRQQEMRKLPEASAAAND